MKSWKYFLLAAFLFVSFSMDAHAKCGRDLTVKSVDELATFTGAPASGDYIPICDTSANVMKKTDASNLTLGGAFNGTVGATTPGSGSFTSLNATSFTGQGITASTTLTGNPLQQRTVGVLTLASVNAGTVILASATGRTIYPDGGLTLMASGSAAGATGVYLRCGGSNNVIASVPIAMLLNGIPVSPFKSAGTGGGSPVLASALTQGCLASDNIYISTTGTLTTTTHLYYSLPYIVQ